MIRKWLVVFVVLILGQQVGYAQDTLRALFLGNSYTQYNNLPQLVSELSRAANKVLIVDSNMPGGHTFANHSTNATSLTNIRTGNWDYVILQEQSQIPTIDFYRINSTLPAAKRLRDTIMRYNSCATIITYMTWGRRFGGRQCDGSNTHCSADFANFNQMQDTLTKAYIEISDSINAQCAPVGVAWQNVLNDTNLVLHIADNSHPTLAGSYVAACVLYGAIWKRSSLNLSYTAGLTNSLARYIQAKSDTALFSQTQRWNLNINKPEANFQFQDSGLSVDFSNLSTALNPLTYRWDFGDDSISIEENPIHSYAQSGTYTVTLIASFCNNHDTIQRTVTVAPITGISKKTSRFKIYPNPAKTFINISGPSNLPYQVLIINSLGKEVLAFKNCTGNTQFNIAKLPKGIYTLTVLANGIRHTEKLVKE